MARVRDRSPGTRLAIMYHETYVPVENWKFAVMTTWQRYQFWRLGRAADTLLFSTHRWAEVHRPWFRDKPVFHLPVGSNVPREPITSSQARSRLGIADDEVVLGVFGTAHVSRLFTTLNAAARAVQAAGRRVRVLYVGPGGAVVRASLDADIPLIADGPLPADEVSRRLSSMDIALSTYTDGVSTRRGAMMAALQHGIAVVGTRGVGTDPELLAENGRGLSLWPVGDDASLAAAVVRLAGDEVERARLAAAGLALFENRYAWPVVARRLLACLGGQSESPRMA
jgi:glycosyltransferase involved in cell wall biosynthesis